VCERGRACAYKLADKRGTTQGGRVGIREGKREKECGQQDVKGERNKTAAATDSSRFAGDGCATME